MTEMTGAIKAEAATAEVRSAASRNPRLEVFHCTTVPGSILPFFTDGTGICDEGIGMVGWTFDEWFELLEPFSPCVVAKEGMLTAFDTCHTFKDEMVTTYAVGQVIQEIRSQLFHSQQMNIFKAKSCTRYDKRFKNPGKYGEVDQKSGV